MKNYHIVLADTPNPNYDKRCRYDSQSIKTFPKGTIITEYVSEMSFGDIVVPTSEYKITIQTTVHGAKNYYIPRETFKVLPVTSHVLTPVEEFDTEYSDVYKTGMIREFITRGLLNIEDIREYYNRPD